MRLYIFFKKYFLSKTKVFILYITMIKSYKSYIFTYTKKNLIEFFYNHLERKIDKYFL